ncbi:uncharacterized protein LOC125578131 [Brassica napus]|uniref:uncharacterized protein LOC125578131 n=1 Tax=Brassica napus TaxID=3708 RepID=UPI002078BC96|nr:uncharacterized protein LOC125578131 [Brassica napus]
MEKLRLPTFKGLSDPSTHVTSFNIAMRRANLTDEDKGAGFCQLFVETLEGPALTWFTGLRENSVDCFHDLSTAFLKNYIMFTNQETTVSDLWNLTHTSGQSLRDFMEKFKAIVSKVDIPDPIAVESLMNTLHVDSTFRQDLYRYPTKSVSDAIARSNNFIRMEEDTRAKFAKEAAAKQRPARTNDTRPEPRQHSSGGNTTQKRGYVSSVGDEESPKTAAVTREKAWNHWDRDSASKQSKSSEPASSNSEEPKKWCLYHKRDSHDTKECKVLIGQFFDGITNGTIQMPTSPTTPKNTKSWSKNKEKKAQKSQQNTAPSEERASPERTPVNNVGSANDSSEDEHPRRRRRVEVILSRPCDSSDDDSSTVQPDLRDKLNSKVEQSLTSPITDKDLRTLLKRKSATNEHVGSADLRATISKSSARRIGQNGDLHDQLNSKADDLRIQLNRSKGSDLRRRLESKKKKPAETPKFENTTDDLRKQLESMRATRTPHISVIMGGSPPCGDSVRAVKDYKRQATTSKKWPPPVENDHQITFSALDTKGVHMPHNDPLLVDLDIGECLVAKVLIDTGSSVDLIFRDTLDKMGVDLRDMKPSSRTLTGFNGASEQMIGTIHLPVYAGGITRTVKFSVIRAKAPYNAILGTPWLHSMKAVPSTYHQCVKFPSKDGKTQTIRGDQQAARELLIATVKMQQQASLVNSFSKPLHKIYPQKEEVREVAIDESDPTKIIRVGVYLSDDICSRIVSFIKDNASTFAWKTSDMKGIDPAVTSHELHVDPTFKPIRQKRRKLGPERSKAVNEEVDRLLDAGFITEVRYP